MFDKADRKFELATNAPVPWINLDLPTHLPLVASRVNLLQHSSHLEAPMRRHP